MKSRIKRVDFVGAPGIGKSTLYNELLKRRCDKNNWMTPGELKIVIAARESIKNAHSIRDIIIAILLNIRLFKRIHPILSNIVFSKYNMQLVWENKEQEAAFDKTIKANTISPYPAYVRLLRYGWLLKRIRQVALFQKYAPCNTTLIYDESLAQQIISLGPWHSSDALDDLYAFYDLLGELSAVIFLDTDEGKVVERLVKRRNTRINTAHRWLNDHELAMETKKILNPHESWLPCSRRKVL